MQKLTRFKILHIASLSISFCMAVFFVFSFAMQLNWAYKVYKAIISGASSVCIDWKTAAHNLSLSAFNGDYALSIEFCVHNPDENSQTLYAFIDKENAGFSIDKKEGPYYTISSDNFVKAFCGEALSSFIKFPKSIASKSGNDTIEVSNFGNTNLSFDKTNIQKAAVKLASHTKFSAPQTTYTKKDKNTSKIVTHSFKIGADAVFDFFASIFKDGISHTGIANDYDLSHIFKKIPRSPDEYYNFCLQTNDEKLCSLQCTTPRISGDVYSLMLIFNSSRQIEISISNLTTSLEMMSVLASVKNDGVYFDGAFVCSSSVPGQVIELKLSCDNKGDANIDNSISIYKMTLGEIIKLGKKLDGFSDVISK